jgi:hypothetical protein
MTSRDVRAVQDIYLNRQKWDKKLIQRQVFNTSQMRIGDHSIDKVRSLNASRRTAMKLKWGPYRRQQQVRQNAIIKPTVEGLPNQLEPILESWEDESHNETDETDEEDSDFHLPKEERVNDSETDSSDEEDDDFFYGLN